MVICIFRVFRGLTENISPTYNSTQYVGRSELFILIVNLKEKFQ